MIADLPREICLSCGKFLTIRGESLRLTAEELADRALRWAARQRAREAVATGLPLTEAETRARFPEPLSLPLYGCSARISPAALLGYDESTDTRDSLAKVIGLEAGQGRLTLQTPAGEVFIDSLYLDHLHDVDEASGKSRIDHDHVSFAPLVRRTLERPLEVFLQQPGGAKTRRKLFLALYQLDSAFVYHAVIVTKNSRVLTAFRLNGGIAKFAKMRAGVPLFVSY